SFYSSCCAAHPDLHSFPTRRSSDLLVGLGFDAAAWEVWPTLAAGGTLMLVDDATRLDPARLLDWLVAERIEVAFAPTALAEPMVDRKSTRLNSSHRTISYAVFCLKK